MKKNTEDASRIELAPGMSWVPQDDPPIFLPNMSASGGDSYLVALAEHLGKHVDRWSVAVVTDDENSPLVSTLAAHVPEVGSVPSDEALDFLEGLRSVPISDRGRYVIFLDERAGKALSEGSEEASRMDTYLRLGRSLGVHFVFVGYPNSYSLDLRY